MAKALVAPFVRRGFPFNYDARAASERAGLRCPPESLAHQSFKDECDINTIINRFKIGYEMPEGVRMPTYEDFSEVHDFQSAANAIAQARESFDALPAEVRFRFHNDPADFVAFCSDERNRPEAVKLGLVPPPPAPDPVPDPGPVVVQAKPVDVPPASSSPAKP